MAESAPAARISHVPPAEPVRGARRRRAAEFADYRRHGELIAFVHTEIHDRFAGRGLGSQLIASALDTAPRHGLAVPPFCAFVRAFIAEHEERLDLAYAAAQRRHLDLPAGANPTRRTWARHIAVSFDATGRGPAQECVRAPPARIQP
jgi:predicted GNAT family acetyltransferase